MALDKRPGVQTVGIGETLRRALAKLVLRAVGDQANKACKNIQLCAVIDTSIYGAKHDVGERRREIGYRGAVYGRD